MKENVCVVFLCNKAYFNRFIYTCNQLVTNGNYNGPICLAIGDDLLNDSLLECDTIKQNNIVIQHFPNVQFSDEFIRVNKNIRGDNRQITKKFQWHKIYLFDVFFKQWDYILYLDCGITIFSDISPIINEVEENTLLAHSDAYPTYKWKLRTQFDEYNTEYFTPLDSMYDLNIDYFQTTMMLYDTRIIENDTLENLLHLSYEYPISKTNEQGIMALYFTNIQPHFKQIKTHNENTHFYDYLSRSPHNRYIMLKLV
jgi:hypothetical protein